MKHPVLSIVALLVLVGVTDVAAQQGTPETPATTEAPETRTVAGRVVESTGTYLTIRTAAGEQIAFAVDDMTKLPASLPPDGMVTIEYQVLSDGTSRTIIVTPTNESPAGPDAESNLASPETAPPAEQVSDPGIAKETSLPPTSSVVPAVGLAGLLFLAIGLIVRARRHHRASA